jgi:hypothetical protein
MMEADLRRNEEEERKKERAMEMTKLKHAAERKEALRQGVIEMVRYRWMMTDGLDQHAVAEVPDVEIQDVVAGQCQGQSSDDEVSAMLANTESSPDAKGTDKEIDAVRMHMGRLGSHRESQMREGTSTVKGVQDGRENDIGEGPGLDATMSMTPPPPIVGCDKVSASFWNICKSYC